MNLPIELPLDWMYVATQGANELKIASGQNLLNSRVRISRLAAHVSRI